MPERLTIGMFFIGLAVGLYFPAFPAPLSIINPYLGIIFLVVAVILLVR